MLRLLYPMSVGPFLLLRSTSHWWLLALCLMPVAAEAGDWTFWRGPEYNGSSRETGLIDDWNPKGGPGSNVVWQRDDLGGRSTPIVMNGRLYTLVRADPGTAIEGEKVVCVDAETGETIWENQFNVYLSDVPDTRVGWSSCVGDPETGHIYALGVCGLFQCLDGATGKRIWSRPLHEQFGLLSTYGGRTNFPVICDDLVIISGIVIGWGDMAKPCHRFLGLDKRDGTVVWFEGTRELPYDTNYSSPTLTTLQGQKALVIGSGDGAIWALQPRTGQPIWQYRFSRRGLNVSPLVVDDWVFSGHSEENIVGTAMGSVVGIDATGNGDITDTGELWKLDEIMAGKSSPLAIGDTLYMIDDRAKLHMFNLEDGDRVGKIALGTMMRSSPLYADGKIYTVTAGGRWYILQPDADRGAKKLKSGQLLKGEESHASPICANGRIYLPTSGRLYCLADPNKTPGQEAAPESPAETPVSPSDTAAHLQLVPCEALLRPGDSVDFSVRLFNAKGQFLRDTKATWQLEGLGEIDAEGKFSIPKSATHAATVITASAEGLQGRARVRIVPPLPWNFSFEDIAVSNVTKIGQPPVPWVGCRYRHVVRNENGNKVMVKVTTIPKGTRSRCWFGQSELHDYTIQADVRGSINDGKMPDIGLIAQGYAIDLQGASQQLQIRSWVPQLRMASSIPFSWKPDTWYTVKFRAETDGERAVLKGKVWPRDANEPSAWIIQAEDLSPNLTGSPGLFGNAKDAEITLDNILVTANQ